MEKHQTPKAGNLYSDLSQYYDGFCTDVNYQEQCDFVARVFDCFAESGGKNYLDLACGTGQHLALMQQKEFILSGLDNSQEMLNAARLRCPYAELVLCDLASFTMSSRYDLISCFLYSIHYSHPISALTETLSRSFHALKPGGIFIFDMVDKRGISSRNAITEIKQDNAHLHFRSGWRHDGISESLTLEVEIIRKDENHTQCWQDQHSMTAITIDHLREIMQKIGFEITLFEHDYSHMREWNGVSYNAIVLGKKPRPQPFLSRNET